MSFVNQQIFANYQEYIDNEQELREKIRTVVRQIEQQAKEATIRLQIIHSDIEKSKVSLKLLMTIQYSINSIPVGEACLLARKLFENCAIGYKSLAELIPPAQYHRYSDHWTFITQRIVFLIALTVYLEVGTLVTRETVAEILGLKTVQSEGFHLEIEDYLMGILLMASELSRFATNSVTLGDYERPLQISRFIADLNSGFRLLNLKNDGLRKRFDALKYDVKKIEEVVYDISIRGLRNSQPEKVGDGE
ncbi:translin isoform X1 [Episyrphus balteatus]|uniref:translin isoform X1 n=1 Tax=Episyrphus balteatus TaxID=286459 RepID=UPI002485EC4B|nr:translin isoform X1 [Episyrphus balteatus]